MKYMFIDESGDLGEKGSKNLIILALTTSNPEQLDRIIKNMRRYKFKKELKKANEIKANNSSPELIKHMLKKINEIKDIKVHAIVLQKDKIRSPYLKGNKHKLYNFVAGKLAKNICFKNEKLEVRIDRSKGKFLQKDFNAYFGDRLKENASIQIEKIEHSHSHAWIGLQCADILSWSVYQKHESGNEDYINLLNNIECEISECWSNLEDKNEQNQQTL